MQIGIEFGNCCEGKARGGPCVCGEVAVMPLDVMLVTNIIHRLKGPCYVAPQMEPAEWGIGERP